MDQIENIFLPEDHDIIDPPQTNRIKMGEIFQLQNERYALVCIHCSEEFQYFSEFTLHVQEHLQHIAIQPKVELTVPEDTAIEELIDEPPRPVIETKNLVIKLERINVEEDDSGGGFDDFGDGSGGDGFSDNSSDSDDEPAKAASQPILSKKVKVEDSLKGIKEASSSTKRNTEKTGTKSGKKTTKKSIAAGKFQKLLSEFKSTMDEPANRKTFDLFKYQITSSLFPSNVVDTIEIRLLCKYILRGYKFQMKNGKYFCPVCDGELKTKGNLRRHMYLHIKKPVLECGFCCKRFRTPRYLNCHLRKDHLNEARSYECVYCHKTFEHHRRFFEHIHVHSANQLSCMMCDRKFKMQSSYERHMEKVHGTKTGQIKYENHVFETNPVPINHKVKPVITAFECYMCQKSFRVRRQLRHHIRYIHVQQPQLCLLCGILCSGSASMNRHMKLHYPDETASHICSICGKGFKIRQYLMRHRRKEHQVWADNRYPTCQVCGATFDKKCLLYEHMKMHPFEESRNYVCTICNHAAINSYNLRRHMLTHTEQRSFECNICHKTFRENYANDHMKTHQDVRKHKCQVCGKKFKRAYALKQHMFQHGGAPEHNCDICGKAFSRTDKLLRHRRRHGIPLNYHCRVCNKGFISQKSFELHENGHLKATKKEVNGSQTVDAV